MNVSEKSLKSRRFDPKWFDFAPSFPKRSDLCIYKGLKPITGQKPPKIPKSDPARPLSSIANISQYFATFRLKRYMKHGFLGDSSRGLGKSPKKGFFPGNTQKIPPQSDLLEV
jgi:hypothetical protein